MADISSALRSTIPISLFNRGMAGKVFEDVRRQGAKVVMKNNSPECVLLSPEEYLRLIDEVNDAKLAALAAQRMQGFDPADAIPAEEVRSFWSQKLWTRSCKIPFPSTRAVTANRLAAKAAPTSPAC